MTTSETPDVARLQRECDLYRRLLDLGRCDEPEPFLREALALFVDVTGAREGYLELHDDVRGRRWSDARGLSLEQLQGVRAAISRGIIASALATGKTIVTECALEDDRFSALESVRRARIEAVLCAPIGDDPPRGVLYVQNRIDHRPFTEADRSRAETFVSHLAPFVDRVLARQEAHEGGDPTAAIRQTLGAASVVGRSPALATVLQHVALVSPLDVSVLLTGETGTGKTQLARLIHDNGARASQPFVRVDCTTLQDTLVESELFGAMPGAHSTATRKMPGKIETAERGTLFLDEVGDLSLAAQAKLLHLLHAHEYCPLGSTRPQRANVRVIAATNTDLEQAVAQRRFREDLFYRLHVLPIRVPSLAERRDDVGLLAAHFCAEACKRHDLARLTLSPNAVRAAEAAEWPGNVRQLEHAVEAAVIRAAGERARQVERAHLFPESAGPAGSDDEVTFQEATRRFQTRFLQGALEANGWNVLETSRRLDLARSHVYNLIRAFGLERRRR